MGERARVLAGVACVRRDGVTLYFMLGSWVLVAVIVATESPIAIPVAAIVWLAHVAALTQVGKVDRD